MVAPQSIMTDSAALITELVKNGRFLKTTKHDGQTYAIYALKGKNYGFVQRCIMCKSQEMGSATVSYTNKPDVIVPVCQSCGHYHFPYSHYSYVIHGLAINWATTDDLAETIEAILRKHMPKQDTERMVVEVAEVSE